MSELALAQAHTQRNLDQHSATAREEIAASRAETARFQAETARFQDETARFREDMRASSQAADRRLSELGVRVDQVGEHVAQVSKQMGQLSNKMGTLVEDIVAPSIPEVFSRFFGVQDPAMLVRARLPDPADPSRRQEFDVVAWGGDVFLINETKSRLIPKDIKDLVELLPRARRFFRDAEGKGVVGSLATFYVDPSLVASAEKRGLLVFGLSRGLLDILNRPGFEPRRY